MKLHIGGFESNPDWILYDARIEISSVNCVGRIESLPFRDNSFETIYCSHVLEHVDNSQVENTIQEMFRCTVPKGKIIICVPDLELLLKKLSEYKESPNAHQGFIAMIFGGQRNPYDYHKTGFTETLLTHLMTQTGFQSITRIKDPGIFQDASKMDISLNLEARKP